MNGKSQIKSNVYFIAAFFILFTALPEISAGTENLDEVVARKTRRASNTFFSGENCTSKPAWNNQTLQYSDIVYGTEVWKVTDTANKEAYFGNDIGYSPWSADGKHMAWTATVPSVCFGATRPRFFSNTDGSFLTPGYEASRRGGQYVVWNPAEPATFYDFGSNGLGEGKDNRILYRNTLSATNSITLENWLTFPWASGLYAPEDMYKGSISADGKKAIVFSSVALATVPVYPITLLPAANRQIDDADGWKAPQIDTYWGGKTTPTVNSLHDLFVGGTAATKIWLYFMPSDTNGRGDWWRMTFSGSAADGGPLHTPDYTPPYAWGGEIEPISMNGSHQTEGACSTNKTPWCCDNDAGTSCDVYLSHFVSDRWGTKLLGGYEEGASCAGFSILNANTKLYDNKCINTNGMGHYSWNGWTDWVVSTPSATIVNGGNGTLYTAKYNDDGSVKPVAKVHVREGGSTTATYQSLPRVGQSPDGTKASYVSDFLGNAPNQALDIFWTAVYYPYPPEIKSAAKSGSNVRLTWDFNQGTVGSPNFVNPRTYTTRGWPHETNDRPPSPREIDKFRVWVSTDNNTWSPLGTTTYNNCRGNNECGMWTETAWTYDITQPLNSTRYYALTSLEHSGLESHTLSNVWKVTLDANGNVIQQLQQSGYPANPGGKSPFYTTPPPAIAALFSHKQAPATANGQYVIKWKAPLNASMIRYYNIYAKDGSLPMINATPLADRQKSRIASIPATSDYSGTGSFSYIDWLGNPDGSTKYVVTAVDFQGNETRYIDVPATVKGFIPVTP